MSELQVAMSTGGYAILEESVVQQLKASLRGELLLPSDAAYDKAEGMWDFEDEATINKFWESTVSPLVDFIQKTRPTTPAGVAAKAKFIKKYYHGSDLNPVRPFFDELIALEA